MNDEQWLLTQIPQALRLYPREYALPIEFAVIDAALWTHLNERYPPGGQGFFFHRIPITYGSVHYIMRTAPPVPPPTMLVLPVEPKAPQGGLEMLAIEVRWAMEDTTYIVATPKKGAPQFITPEKQDFLNAFGRWILARFFQSFIKDQERIISLRKDHNFFSKPDINDSPGEHTEWHARFGERLGITVDQYAKQVSLSPQTLYNERKKRGLTKQRKSGKSK